MFMCRSVFYLSCCVICIQSVMWLVSIFFLMIRRPPRSTQSRSSAASDVYKRQIEGLSPAISIDQKSASRNPRSTVGTVTEVYDYLLSLIHISEPTRLLSISYAVFCLKKKKKKTYLRKTPIT